MKSPSLPFALSSAAQAFTLPLPSQEPDCTQAASLFEKWLTTAEAAEYLRIPEGSLRNLTSNGKVPVYKVPGTRLNRYLQSELRNLLLQTKRGGSYGI